MQIMTRGEIAPTEIAVSDALSVRVRAPGIHIRWRTFEKLPGLAGFITTFEELPGLAGVAAAEGGGWAEAIAANELTPVGAVEAVPFALALAPMPMISSVESDEAHVELRAVPPPDEGLLVMVETDGIVQWYLPASTPQAAAGLMGVEAPQRELRFLIPRSSLSVPPMAAIGGEIGGAIVRFFRFKLIQELIGAPLTAIVHWIAENVERKNKEEGFRYFDQTRNFPLVPKAELQAMTGKRVLLLTHGIFSSLRGAFADFAAPANPLLQHLRDVYGDRIIGWDHWTVAKTPFENAADLLAALPPNIHPDIVCHSRGALVTRAMLEHPSLVAQRQARFASVGKAIFVAGANQGSQLASFPNLNRLLNIYSAVGSIPPLGAAGVALKVIVGLLRVLAQVGTNLPSIEALSPDLAKNQFLTALNGATMAPTQEILVVHANYDASRGLLARFLDLNVDVIFGAANDMVVPFVGAELFDKWQPAVTNIRYGTASLAQSEVMHTNFFLQASVQDLLRQELA